MPFGQPALPRNSLPCPRKERHWFVSNQKDDFDYVLHLAAMVGGRMMIEKNPIAVSDDLSIDSHFWQWAVKSKPKKILTFSSSACYPVIYQKKETYWVH